MILKYKTTNHNLYLKSFTEKFITEKCLILGYEFFNQEEKKHFQVFDFPDVFFSVNHIFIKKYIYRSREIMLFSHKAYIY